MRGMRLLRQPLPEQMSLKVVSFLRHGQQMQSMLSIAVKQEACSTAYLPQCIQPLVQARISRGVLHVFN